MTYRALIFQFNDGGGGILPGTSGYRLKEKKRRETEILRTRCAPRATKRKKEGKIDGNGKSLCTANGFDDVHTYTLLAVLFSF